MKLLNFLLIAFVSFASLPFPALAQSHWTSAGDHIHANNAPDIVVTDTGEVGIGTTDPQSPLTIKDLDYRQLGFDRREKANIEHLFYIGPSWGTDDIDHLSFHTDGPAGPNIMVLKSTGKVGIGTTSPAELLDVNGSAKIQGSVSVSQDLEVTGTVQAMGGLQFADGSVQATAASADGVVPIDETTAINDGIVDAGDTAGLPVTITVPGSYKLVSNLTTADPNQDILVISADGVTVDLNGFNILGPAACSGIPASCTGTGSGRGVVSGNRGLMIKNGIVSGMGSHGITLSQEAKVVQVQAIGNGGNGIHVEIGAIENCLSTSNAGHGAVLGQGGRIQNSTLRRNGGIGIEANDANVFVADNVIQANGSQGVYAGQGAYVRNNALRSNGQEGITFFDSTGVYSGNVLTQNNGGGAQVASGSQLGSNFCSTSTACP